MKKRMLSVVMICFLAIPAFSQPDTLSLSGTTVEPFFLSVGWNVTTVLIFRSQVKEADRGSNGIHSQKQPGVENVLKIKAARKDFVPTNLTVFTGDGKIYTFKVVYSAEPAQTVYDLSRVETTTSLSDNGQAVLTNRTIQPEEWQAITSKIKREGSFFSKTRRGFSMRLRLRTIYHAGDMLLLGFQIANRSNLPYHIDLTQLTIQDQHKVKRTSVQSRIIVPLLTDTLTVIPPRTAVSYVMAVPQFTIPNKRQLLFSIFEKNGGREVSLPIRNRNLFKSKEIIHPMKQ